MTEPYLIVAAAVAGVLLVLVAAAMFGVSRRAVEAEIRRVEEDDEAGEAAGGERGDSHLAA
jgi:hypothetical protein